MIHDDEYSFYVPYSGKLIEDNGGTVKISEWSSPKIYKGNTPLLVIRLWHGYTPT